MTRLNMQAIFALGDTVQLAPERSWTDDKYNPRDTTGKIVEIHDEHRYTVRWDNGVTNGLYYPRHLIKVTPQTKDMNLNPIALAILSDDDQALVKAGILSDDLSMTTAGKEQLVALLFVANKAALVEAAKIKNLKNETSN